MFAMSRLILGSLLACAAVATTFPSPLSGYDETGNMKARRRALLVGCTKYPGLGDRYTLQGPANDVALIGSLLTDRFQFAAADIVRLLHDADDEHRPTRANILREFDRLAAEARDGDETVILLAGHGSQLADDDGDEDDGLDEAFLPEDVTRGGRPPAGGIVIPGIRDDEIERRLTAMRERGAFVFFLADTCHSGTLTRGPAEEEAGTTARHVLKEELSSVEELRAATKPLRRSDPPRQEVSQRAPSRGGLAAIYAVPPTAVEQEQPMPPPSADRHAPRYGRLTYTLHQVLAQSQTPLTYRELAQQVAWQYRRWDFLPFPLLEGSALDREVLGKREWQDRSSLVLSRNDAGRLELNQGTVHGLTADTLLRVLPSGGAGEANTLLGYVRVSEVRPFTALCKPEPSPDRNQPLPKDWPTPARCEIVSRGQALDVARVRIRPSDAAAAEAAAALTPKLLDLARAETVPFRLAAAHETADIYLVASPTELSLHTTTIGDAAAHNYPWSAAADKLPESLVADLRRLANARNLLRLATPEVPREGKFQPGEVGLAIDLERATAADGPWLPVDAAMPPRLTRGDLLRVRLRNIGVSRLDATVLYVDSSSQIQSLSPTFRAAQAGVYNTIASEQSQEVVVKINDSTVGPEDLLVLAVVHVPPLATHFAFLQQPGLTKQALQSHRGAGDSPLGKLLGDALSGTRGTQYADQERSYAVRRIPLEVYSFDAKHNSQ